MNAACLVTWILCNRATIQKHLLWSLILIISIGSLGCHMQNTNIFTFLSELQCISWFTSDDIFNKWGKIEINTQWNFRRSCPLVNEQKLSDKTGGCQYFFTISTYEAVSWFLMNIWLWVVKWSWRIDLFNNDKGINRSYRKYSRR